MSERVIVGRVPSNIDPNYVCRLLEQLATQYGLGVTLKVESIKTKK